MENVNIHKTAIIHPGAKISPGVSIGPYSIIEGDVTLGDNVRIGSHCVITGQTKIGRNCKIFTGAVIGSPPQDLKHSADDNVFLNIGENNIIREYVTINPGTLEGGGKTLIGNNNLIMAYAHVAHDCIIGNNCVMANAATLGGHVTLEDSAIIGGFSAVHQFVRLGRLSIVGGCSKVVQDVPPFSMCDGHPVEVIRTNAVGLKRAQISEKSISLLKKAFKILFRSGLTKTHSLEKVSKEVETCPELDHLIFFIKTTERGICS
ncbi:MAG: acyl-ACP--UDP-N-acetylglucosamine O-acyltransferase [Candidatus Omnitrophica bacterium]|nr:acyl-ACP--UDP-N-acetylglucosamine O-acyltransferase [Candidatus Omnitrophota bacterium]MCB9747597.1 acyl-ACP--UDP-N-acetylglucosamine O-acyltransferase [Candidatus Omnitrophota bacterium]